ncbi:IclR family transcriptional regulator [Propionibacteriaceae bacterium G1746]
MDHPYDAGTDSGLIDPGSIDPGSIDPGSIDPGSIDPGSIDADKQNPIGTLQRGLAILGVLASGEQPTVGSLIERFDLSKSAAFRVLMTLREHELIEWDSTLNGVVLPSVRSVHLGMAGLRAFDPWEHGRVELVRLAQQLDEAALMAVRDGDEMVYIAHEDRSDHAVGVRRLLGSRRPMYCSSLGKAFLLRLDEADLDSYLQRAEFKVFTPTTITDPDQLRRELLESRTRGWAIDRAEHESGVMCFGAAVVDHVGQPVCSISVAGPYDRINEGRDHIVALLMQTARSISERLGHAPRN